MRNLLFGAMLFTQLEVNAALIVNETNLRELLLSQSAVLQAQKIELDSAKKQRGSLLRSFLPSVEFYTAAESFKIGRQSVKSQPAYGAEIKLNLLNGGRDAAEENIREKNAELLNHSYDKGISQELLKARLLYWDVIYHRQLIILLNEAAENNKKNQQSAARRIANGLATDSDKTEFEMQQTDIKREILLSDLQIKRMKKELALVLGIDRTENLVIEGKLDHQHSDTEFFSSHMDAESFLIKEAESAAAVSELTAEKTSRFWWPRLDAFAQYHQYNERENSAVDSADRRESSMGLKLTVHLDQAAESRIQAQTSREKARALRLRTEFVKKDMAVHAENEAADLTLLHELVHEAEENIQRAEKYYKQTSSEYARGVKNSPDMLSASEKFFGARKNQLAILRNFQLTKAHLLSKTNQ